MPFHFIDATAAGKDFFKVLFDIRHYFFIVEINAVIELLIERAHIDIDRTDGSATFGKHNLAVYELAAGIINFYAAFEEPACVGLGYAVQV